MKNKIKYVKPTCKLFEIKLEHNLAATSNATVSFGDNLNYYSPSYESWNEESEKKNTFEF